GAEELALARTSWNVECKCRSVADDRAAASAFPGCVPGRRVRLGLIQGCASLCVWAAVAAGVGRTDDGAAGHLAAITLGVGSFPVASRRRSRTIDGALGLAARLLGQGSSGRHGGEEQHT